MRISDWSSDVCSSDLGAECRIHDSFRCCRCSCSEIGNQSRDRNDYSKQDNVVYGLAKPSMKETPCRFEQCKGDENGSRSEEHTSELQSLMRISYAVFCLKKKKQKPQ